MPEAAFTAQPVPAPDTKAMPAGSVSRTVTVPPVATLPRLSADSVHVPGEPTVNGPAWRLKSATSGAELTAVVVRVESFAGVPAPALAGAGIVAPRRGARARALPANRAAGAAPAAGAGAQGAAPG